MSIALRRAELAQTITAGLDDITVNPYRDYSPAPFTGWLEIGQIDTQDVPLRGFVRLTVECLVLVAADRTDFEKVSDALAVDLIKAVETAGGLNVVVTPFTEQVSSTTLFALSARFITESEA